MKRALAAVVGVVATIATAAPVGADLEFETSARNDFGVTRSGKTSQIREPRDAEFAEALRLLQQTEIGQQIVNRLNDDEEVGDRKITILTTTNEDLYSLYGRNRELPPVHGVTIVQSDGSITIYLTTDDAGSIANRADTIMHEMLHAWYFALGHGLPHPFHDSLESGGNAILNSFNEELAKLMDESVPSSTTPAPSTTTIVAPDDVTDSTPSGATERSEAVFAASSNTVTYPTSAVAGAAVAITVCVTDVGGAPVAGAPGYATLGNDPASPAARHANAPTGDDGCTTLEVDTDGMAGATALWTSDGVESQRVGNIDISDGADPDDGAEPGAESNEPGILPMYEAEVIDGTVDPALQPAGITTIRDAVGNIFVRICFDGEFTRERLDELEEWFLSIGAGPEGDSSFVELFWDGEELSFRAYRSSGEFAPSARIVRDGCLLVYTGLSSSSGFAGIVAVESSTTEPGADKEHAVTVFDIHSEGAVQGTNEGNVNDVFPGYTPLFSSVDDSSSGE